jgi:hypothetical protein
MKIQKKNYISYSAKLSRYPTYPVFSQCGFGTCPSTAKFLVAAGSANRMPSSSGLAITWQPRRDLK